MHSASSAELIEFDTSIFKTSYEESVEKKERERVDAQIAAYDALYKKYDITSRDDLFNIRIREYIEIATFGIAYVKHHHPIDDTENAVKNATIRQSCDDLLTELMTKEAEGLTPVEFILFNMKLGLLQEYHPDGYPLEFDQETKAILEDGRWRAIPFYESQDLYPLELDSRGPRPIISGLFEQDNEMDYAFKPYIIYTPNGGFSISRIVDNLLRDDGKHRNLCALPIGTVDVKYSPHGLYNRTAFDFLIHDLFHSKTCWKVLSELEKQNLLDPITTIKKAINEPVIRNFIFLLVHENMYRMAYMPSTSDTFLKTLKQNIENSKTNIASFRDSFDPFPDVLTRVLADNVGYRGTSSDSRAAASDALNHYKGITRVRINNKHSTFTYEVQRTGKVLIESPFYEYAIVLAISHIPDNDTNPIDSQFIDQILASAGNEYVAITIAGRATSRQGIVNIMAQALGNQQAISLYLPEDILSQSVELDLAEQLLHAFKAKVTELMPGALT